MISSLWPRESRADDKTAAFSMTLEAGQQEIIAEVVDELRRRGVAGLGSGSRALAGAVFATAVEGDMSGIVIGARTGSEGGGGQYSVFYNAVPFGEAFSREAWVDGLQQNQENRSNLALVNTGEVDGSAERFPSRDLRRGDGVAGRDSGDQADPGPALASDQRDLGQSLPGNPAGVYPDREGFRGEPLPGLRGGQRRRGPGRAQRRRSLPAGEEVGDARDRTRAKRYPRAGTTKRQKDIHEGPRRTAKGH